MGFQDLKYAQALRDVVRELAMQEIKRLRPGTQLATVSTVNADGTCSVVFPGDDDPVPVRMHTIRPTTGGGPGVGDVVRVSGDLSRRYVTEVVKGNPLLYAGRIVLNALETTASSANMFIDSATGIVYRSTSSRRYKRKIEPAVISDATVMALKPVTYKAKGLVYDSKTYIGLIAEDLADEGDPTLDKLVELDPHDRPDAVNYDRVAVVLIPTIQRLLKRVAVLEAKLNDQA